MQNTSRLSCGRLRHRPEPAKEAQRQPEVAPELSFDPSKRPQNGDSKKERSGHQKPELSCKVLLPSLKPKSQKSGSGEGHAAGPVSDLIFVRFWTCKIGFWRRPRALWCFPGSSFRDLSILGTKTKKNSFGARFGHQNGFQNAT